MAHFFFLMEQEIEQEIYILIEALCSFIIFTADILTIFQRQHIFLGYWICDKIIKFLFVSSCEWRERERESFQYEHFLRFFLIQRYVSKWNQHKRISFQKKTVDVCPWQWGLNKPMILKIWNTPSCWEFWPNFVNRQSGRT